MQVPEGVKVVEGGVTAPKGFLAAGVHCGIKPGRPDLALLYSTRPARAAAVFTRNILKAAPLLVTMENLKDGMARAVVANSGNANACTGKDGESHARRMGAVAADSLGIHPQEVIVASTGVIGVPLPINLVEEGIRHSAENLSVSGGNDAVRAIMTTDTRIKEVAVELMLRGRMVTIGGMAKGSGMIHPDMATMLAFITTDAGLPVNQLQVSLKEAVDKSFNMITVDGDTSPNDMLALLANGQDDEALAGEDWTRWLKALSFVCIELARKIARDGEGATRLLEVRVIGASSLEDARKAARTIAASNLVKTAVFGCDANWGRIVTALGYSGASFLPAKVDIWFSGEMGQEQVASNGIGLAFSEEVASRILGQEEVTIIVDLKSGEETATAWGCDLTYDYVRINADYRS